MFNEFIHRALNFLFPQKCLGCGKENEILCQQCLESVSYPTLTKDSDIFAAADYGDEIVKKAIWMLKYRGIKGMAEPLAELIKQRVGNKIKIQDNLIIPIPLSKKRFKERGFNHAELIAKYLTSDVDGKNIGCLTNVLYKIKDTPSQVSIKNREQRLNNLKGAFAVKNSHLIAGKNILFIDDVSTTGATIREARRVLRESGAKKIMALVVARG